MGTSWISRKGRIWEKVFMYSQLFISASFSNSHSWAILFHLWPCHWRDTIICTYHMICTPSYDTYSALMFYNATNILQNPNKIYFAHLQTDLFSMFFILFKYFYSFIESNQINYFTSNLYGLNKFYWLNHKKS